MDPQDLPSTARRQVVIDYRNPSTRTRRPIDLSNPAYPLALAAASAVFGLGMPNNAGGSPFAWLASLGLLVAACWFIAARLYRDPRVVRGLQPLLWIVAVACVIWTAMICIHGGARNMKARWDVYDEIPRSPLGLAALVSTYAVLRLATRKRQSISR